jgi:hypothetical protein
MVLGVGLTIKDKISAFQKAHSTIGYLANFLNTNVKSR